MSISAESATATDLAVWVRDARQRTFELTADLDDEQLMGPQLSIVNPLLWEIGHVAWFQEKWVLRHVCGREPLHPDADALYDSMAIDHDTRWDLPLLSRRGTFSYAEQVRDQILEVVESRELDEQLAYFVKLGVFHEDMHTEAFSYTRQTLGYAAPRIGIAGDAPPAAAPDARCRGDVELPGGTFQLGASRGEPFVFDNEKWAHPVEIRPFAIARTAVTQAEFADFVDDGGYQRDDLWCEASRGWRRQHGGQQPVYWKRQDNGNWLRRHFGGWVGLESDQPVFHVNWFEADAYCRWAGRRLPTEAEWELAASVEPNSGLKRSYPWGDGAPAPANANLDWHQPGAVNVDALPDGDSAFGCRQLLGNVWEWTASDFLPYPGFVADPYKDYSEPWFGTRKVLRGGCWATRSRMIRNTWRNFYTPDRRDVWAGFRTCPGAHAPG